MVEKGLRKWLLRGHEPITHKYICCYKSIYFCVYTRRYAGRLLKICYALHEKGIVNDLFPISAREEATGKECVDQTRPDCPASALPADFWQCDRRAPDWRRNQCRCRQPG